MPKGHCLNRLYPLQVWGSSVILGICLFLAIALLLARFGSGRLDLPLNPGLLLLLVLVASAEAALISLPGLVLSYLLYYLFTGRFRYPVSKIWMILLMVCIFFFNAYIYVHNATEGREYEWLTYGILASCLSGCGYFYPMHDRERFI